MGGDVLHARSREFVNRIAEESNGGREVVAGAGWEGHPRPPPRMRGRQSNPRAVTIPAGTTPAYAGKTCAAPSWIARPRDHPRVCGGDWPGTLFSDDVGGPPPRMRGRPYPSACGGGAVRTTPAYAGKTKTTTTRPSSMRDHPRVCGEDACASVLRLKPCGPPPRMRGRHLACGGENIALGTTPAHAGKTSLSYKPGCGKPDHPRACGEDATMFATTPCPAGPPPRMRGRPRLV